MLCQFLSDSVLLENWLKAAVEADTIEAFMEKTGLKGELKSEEDRISVPPALPFPVHCAPMVSVTDMARMRCVGPHMASRTDRAVTVRMTRSGMMGKYQAAPHCAVTRLS